MRLTRSLGVALAALCLIATANPVAAGSRTIHVIDLPFFGCAASQPDVKVAPGVATEGAIDLCFVRFSPVFPHTGEAWQASTGEWIFFQQRIVVSGCSDPIGTPTMTLDGSTVPVDVLCQAAPQGAPFAFWVGLGYLSPPLPPGSHTATFALGPDSTPLAVTVTVVHEG